MRVLVVNPIMYTSESPLIHKVNSIKDTMCYDLCLAFNDLGHEVTLIGGEPYKPIQHEQYPYNILWMKCSKNKVFMLNCFPYMPELRTYIKRNKNQYDMVITSEVFSVNSLILSLLIPEKTIVWHELAKHNAIFHKIPSKIWYGIIARLFMRKVLVVPRSIEAQTFIMRYCKKVSSKVIEHGVNLKKFKTCETRNQTFVVCSQLIPRKRIDGIITKFGKFLEKFKENIDLYIIGDGECRAELQKQADSLVDSKRIKFLGKLTHDEIIPILSGAYAMLVNTEKDNSMVSIIESIAVGTPVITTSIPLNSSYIKKYKLGIVNDNWDEDDLYKIVSEYNVYSENCRAYRPCLSTEYKVGEFVDIKSTL